MPARRGVGGGRRSARVRREAEAPSASRAIPPAPCDGQFVSVATGRVATLTRSDLLDLDLDVDACGQVESLQRFDGLARGLHDVDEPLVDAHLEVLAAVLVDVR